jgi:long-subunit fatty acid transport protein
MMGAAYQLKDFVQLRAGFNVDQTVVNDNTFIPHFMDLADRYGVSLGIGFDIQNWRLEMTGVYTHYNGMSVGSSEDVNDDGLMDNIVGDYDADVYRTVLGISYRF